MTLDLTSISDEEALASMGQPEAETVATDDSVIELDEPVEWKREQFSVLRLREPLVAQVKFSTKVMGRRATQVTVRDAQLDLVARVTGWPAGAIDLLPTTVQDRAILFVTDFEENARRPIDAEPDRSPELRLLFSPAIEAVGLSHGEMLLREPVGRQRRRYDVSRERDTPEAILDAEINLVADVSQWPMAAVLKAPISQFARAADYLTGFFIRGPRTGPTSRPS